MRLPPFLFLEQNMKPDSILNEVKKIVARSGHEQWRYTTLLENLEKTFNPKTLSHERDFRHFDMYFVGFINGHCSVRDEDKDRFWELRNETAKFLEGLGYRHSLDRLTYQEASFASPPKDEVDNPYTPIGVLSGAITIEEALKARELSVFTYAHSAYFEGLEKAIGLSYVRISLEPLDKDGRSVRDPQLLDEDLKPVTTFEKAKIFPFPRE